MTHAALAAAPRPALLDRLEGERFDCLVVGGGITGAGAAREAALRGLRVALLEAADFAAGTSSRSSKLIHGGLRYLAMGDVATVRATARERRAVRGLAPHLAEPRWMLVPARSRAGLLKLRAALATYEKLGGVDEADRHQTWSGADLARGEPLLDRAAHPHACAYREYLTDDARLVLATLRAATAAGAVVASYAPVCRIGARRAGAQEVEAECAETGRRIRVRTRGVVNAAGPWVDPVRALEDAGAAPLLHLSKGVHVALPRERLPLRHVAVLNAADRRSIFAVPRGAVVYLGTTDTSYPKGPDLWPPVEREDVEYLLEPLRRYFEGPPPTPDEVVAAWAGLRPLLAEAGKASTELSRRDEIGLGPGAVVHVAGGKLTGFLPMARRAVERLAREVGLALAPPPEPGPLLPGGDLDGDLDAPAAALADRAGLSRPCAERLVRLYGSEAPAVAARGPEPLDPEGRVLAGEVDWAVAVEGALHLEDVLYRRLRTALYEPGAREGLLEPVAGRLAAALGWDGGRREREIEATRRRLAADLAFRGGGAHP